MAIDPKLVSIKMAGELPVSDPTDNANFLFYEGEALKRSPMANIYDKVSSGLLPATTATVPSATGFERYIVHEAGIYTNFLSGGSPIEVTSADLDVVNGVANNRVILEVQEGVATKRVERVKGDAGVAGATIAQDVVPGTQLFQTSHVINDKYIDATLGEKPAAGWQIVKIPIQYIAGVQEKISISGQTISISTEHNFVDTSDVIITKGTIPVPNAPNLTIPTNAAFLKFSVKRPADGTGYLTSLMVNYGASALPYEPYTVGAVKKLDGREIYSDKVLFNGEYVEVAEAINSLDGKNEIRKTGSTVLIRSSFNVTQDLVRAVSLTGGQNGSSNLLNTRLINKTDAITATGTLIHNHADSVPPPFQVYSQDTGAYYFNIGGNHGLGSVLDATATAHGKTSADLLSVWTDGTGWEWYLMEILSVNSLRFASKPKNVGGLDKVKATPLSPLMHVSGATNTGNISFTGSAYEYKPAINSISVKLYIDDVEVTADGGYFGDVVKIIDTHNVADPTQPSLVVPYLPQNNGTMVKNTLIHTFYKNGSYTAENIADWQKSHSLNNQGIIQPEPLTRGAYTQHNAYFTNVAGVTDFNPTTVTSKYNYKTNLIDQTKTIQQQSQILFDGGTPKIGAGFGYNPLVGVGKSEHLLSNNIQSLLASSKKYYAFGWQGVTNTNIIRGIGYFAYWDATKNPKLSSDYYVPHGNQDLYFINIRQAMTKEKVYMAAELLNREFEIVHKSDGLTLHTEDTITSEGLTITGAIGDWAVLKIK